VGIGLSCCLGYGNAGADDTLRVGSKRFTESYILAEVIARSARMAGVSAVEHKPGLGNTAILFQALKTGAIDVYPEYTGTIALELLGLDYVPRLAELNQLLKPSGLASGIPLGFSNSYGLAMHEELAETRGVRRISDLAGFAGARYGFSAEFLGRRDGWQALRRAYGLDTVSPRSLEHGLAYDALVQKRVDVIDVYTTDARLATSQFRVLQDDRGHFPEYQAVLIYRADFPERFARIWPALRQLEGRISVPQMRQMNAAVEVQGRSFAAVAEDLDSQGTRLAKSADSLWSTLFAADLPRLTVQHLSLVCASLLLSMAAGVPLGILAQRRPGLGAWVLGLTGMLQTIPSLALLAFLVATLDRIGAIPAILALFLYSLLPVVRNTESALSSIGSNMRQAGDALGMHPRQRMLLIELPLALPGILAGIKTAAVINVGTATIAAFIGAGGYGERIVSGLAVNDHHLLLAGAIPAALLALLVEWGFRLLERRWSLLSFSGRHNP